MAVTAPVSLSKIKTEFSGPNTFSSYTRGGTYVPNIAANSAISTTVAGLAMSQFLNAVALSVQLEDFNPGFGRDINQDAGNFQSGPDDGSEPTATVILQFNSDGTYVIQVLTGDGGCGGGPGLDQEDTFTWLLAGNASDYSARFDVSSGGFTSGSATGANHNLSSNPPVYEICSDSSFGDSETLQVTGTLTIRDSGNNVLASKILRFAVESEFQP